MRRRSSRPARKERPRETFSVKKPGPGMVLRPALPKREAGGRVKAAGLKKASLEVMGWPVASARPLPTDPLPPELARFPRTRAVKGEPEPAVRPPERFQSASRRVAQP